MNVDNNNLLVTPFGLGDDLRDIRDRITIPTPPPEDTENDVPPPPPPPEDTESPTSTVEVLPNSVPQEFTVTWYGFDLGGSGIATYDVFVSTDGGEFVLWQDDTTALSATYIGQSDRSYEFFSVATDNAGNVESNDQVQASTSANGSSQQPVIYRLFNTSTGVHLYTANVAERDSVIQNLSNYEYEGVSYFAAQSNQGVPVYRLYSPVVDGHFYTVDPSERDTILANNPDYVLEGEAFTAFADDGTAPDGTTPVYRFFVAESGAYFYTASEVERDSIINNLSNYEFQGIAFYSFPLDADFSPLPPAPDPDGTNFLGADVFLQLYGPDGDTAVTEGLIATVGEGIEFDDLVANDIAGGLVPVDVSIDITANNVLFEVEQAGSGTFDTGELNAYIVIDANDSLAPISSVSVNESETTLGVTQADIFFTEDGFAVNVAGLDYTQGDTIKLDVTFGAEGSIPPEAPVDPPPTSNSNFIGAELQYQTLSPNFDTPVSDPIDATVGDGIEFDLGIGGDGATGGFVDVSANKIIYEVDFTGDSVFTEAEFNGFVIIDITDTLPAIANVTINQSGTTLGIDNSDFVFTEDGIAVNVEGIPFSDGDRVELDVEFV